MDVAPVVERDKWYETPDQKKWCNAREYAQWLIRYIELGQHVLRSHDTEEFLMVKLTIKEHLEKAESLAKSLHEHDTAKYIEASKQYQDAQRKKEASQQKPQPKRLSSPKEKKRKSGARKKRRRG